MQGDTQAIYFIACTHNTPNTKKGHTQPYNTPTQTGTHTPAHIPQIDNSLMHWQKLMPIRSGYSVNNNSALKIFEG